MKQIKPLPNLDYKIVAGNSLFGVEKNLFNQVLFKQLEDLKPRYFDATDRLQKEGFKTEIDGLIHELTSGKEAFDYEIYFSEVFHHKKGFDVVIANPPYEEISDKAQTARFKANYSDVLSGHYDLYIFFFRQAFRISRKGSTVSFITPHTYLQYSQYQRLRTFLYSESHIHEMTSRIEGVFESAVVDNAIIVLTVGAAGPEDQTFFSQKAIQNGVLINQATQSLKKISFSDAAFFLEAINNASVISRLSPNTRPLGSIVDSTQGIIVFEAGQGVKVDHFRNAATDSTCKPVTRGREIGKYCLEWSGKFIRYGEWLCRSRDSRFFESPKIFLRQTSDTLICTFVEHPFYCIDSVHSLILKPTERDCSLKFILGILNSALGAYIYKLLICETGKVFAQVKLTFLRQIPIKNASSSSRKSLEHLVDCILAAKSRDSDADVSNLEREIDELVFALYGLTPEEIEMVKCAK